MPDPYRGRSKPFGSEGDALGVAKKIEDYFKRSFRNYAKLHPDAFREAFKVEPTPSNADKVFQTIHNGGINDNNNL
jgi:hypothetical protein